MYNADKASTTRRFELRSSGTNHLGHFALTGQLLDNMLPVDGSRVVTRSCAVSATASGPEFISRTPQLERNYDSAVVSYGQSQAGQPCLFTCELARRLKLKGAPTGALAAHPGAADTDLLPQHAGRHQAGQRVLSGRTSLRPRWSRCGAACGHPKVVKSSAQSHDEDVQRRLWERFPEEAHRTSRIRSRRNAFRRRAPARRRRPDQTPSAGSGTCRWPTRFGLVLAEDVVAPPIAAWLRQFLGDGRLRRRRRRHRGGERRTAGAAARRRRHIPAQAVPDLLDAETRYGTPDHDGRAGPVRRHRRGARRSHRLWRDGHRVDPCDREDRAAHPPRRRVDVTAGTTVLRAGQVVITPAQAASPRHWNPRRAASVVPRQRVLVML